MNLEGFQTGPDTYLVIAAPAAGRRVIFHVQPTGRRNRYRVTLGAGREFSNHPDFASAVKAANSRAKRYVSAFRRPIQSAKKELENV